MESNLFQLDRSQLGVIVVDHGSRREQSNELLLDVVRLFRDTQGWPIVEPAHMELAEPSIATAFERCVEQGARLMIVFPYFLLPGRHWNEDIPRLAADAAAQHSGVEYLVTAPLGVHALMAEIMNDRIIHCLNHAHGLAEECDLCKNTGRCQLRPGS